MRPVRGIARSRILSCSWRGTWTSALTILYLGVYCESTTVTPTTVEDTTVSNGNHSDASRNNTVIRNLTASVDFSQRKLYPYRICSMSMGTDLVRFARTIQCVPFNPRVNSEEGIMLIYKRNILPYVFTAYTYQKELLFQRSYKYVTYDYLLGYSREFVALPMWEIFLVNSRGQCYTSHQRVIGADRYIAYHNDNEVNETMWLMRDDMGNDDTYRYITVKEHARTPGSVWLYKETCSMNCIVTKTKGKSKFPYDMFVLPSGVIVNISPFYNGSNGKTFREQREKFHIWSNYSILKDFGSRALEARIVPKMAFYEREDVVIGWEVNDQSNVTCEMILWETVDRAIRTEYENAFHYVARTLTSTFVENKYSPDNNLTEDDIKCFKNDAQKKIEEVFLRDYNETYDMDGNATYHVTTGGLVIVWQGLKQKSLKALEIAANESAVSATGSNSRRKRSLPDESTGDISYAQLQFAYDTLRTYINQALGHIAEAWCLDQKRTAEVLHELSKINPSNILSAIFGVPVAARVVGDVISLAKCIEVNQSTVLIKGDMRKFSDDGKLEGCYSRPVVWFSMKNSTEVRLGQLGEDNEILLGTHRMETCQTQDYRIFVAGDIGYEFQQYVFTKKINLSEIDIIDTMIALKTEPLENIDFKVLELYSRDELAQANVFDLESIMREYNYQKKRLDFVVERVINPIPPALKGLDEMMNGMGAIGKGIGEAVGAVGGAIGSFIGALVTFVTNPFGAFVVFLFCVGCITLVITVYRRQRRAMQRPFDYFFPYASQTITSSVADSSIAVAYPGPEGTSGDAPPPYPGEAPYGYKDLSVDADTRVSSSSAGAGADFNEEDAVRMLRAIKRLDDKKRQEIEKSSKDSASNKNSETRRRPGIMDRLRRRGGYQKLNTEDDVHV
ncbi:glycoprotein B [Caviid betaherpesvirus 2]|uniref:Envelope glycoprotein B n=1 Tax=Guinea pig cytomegalovirus (strain 22122) TaxID=103920 RepID=GB_GPCMV|nr:glycoprotein B [Caviid betaherpesvirus 2]Q69024.1 RecName: Full=Envelope glycoprotein B; Short=gB; Flags: Precursor [Guinea pig cytomegalovirus (strain 22122 / ATCC VR682) (GPCMV)]AIL83922.1 glycoprotein B [BAC cloning vector GPN13BACdenovo_preserved(MM)]AGE11534.1 glycoprotein B [Caviid betaherpesvirus 2]BAJ78523.1 GP55 [Caviid betaherpesvirus 2]prf//2116347A glycoprotein B [Caviid betaherpesvirus 2]